MKRTAVLEEIDRRDLWKLTMASSTGGLHREAARLLGVHVRTFRTHESGLCQSKSSLCEPSRASRSVSASDLR